MKNVILTQLRLHNFKGCRDLTIRFEESATHIHGANTAGKTTVFDAFTWLLFGKDSTGRENYGIKTLDKNSNPIHRLDHEVEGTFMIDGRVEKLKRVYKESWVTKRGSTTEELKGHDVSYYWNDVPMKAGEYSSKVSSIIEENMFKLITSPTFFPSLHWEKQRQALLDIAGTITTEEIIATIATADKTYGKLIAALNAGKTAVEFKKELAAKRKKLKDEIEQLPIRINEARRNMPEEQNWAAIEKLKAEKEAAIGEIDAQLEDITRSQQTNQQEILGLQDQVFKLRERYSHKQFEIKQQLQSQQNTAGNQVYQLQSKVNATYNNLANTEHDIKTKENQVQFNGQAIAAKEQTRVKLLGDWQGLNAEKFESREFHFDETACNCPVCKQALPSDSIATKKAELEAAFNAEEAKRQIEFNNSIARQKGSKQSEASAVKNEKAALEEKNAMLIAEIEQLKVKLPALQKQLADEQTELQNAQAAPKETFNLEVEVEKLLLADEEAQAILSEGTAHKEQIEKLKATANTESNATLKANKQAIATEVDGLKNMLSLKDVISKTNARIAELEAQESKLAQEIADLEQQEFEVDAFERGKMDIMEKRINGLFTYVSFKLFDRQINGGEAPCCEALINGVPYSHANYASKVNAGLDIINVLCRHYNVTAPVFIDNRESVSNIVPMQSQVINLVVDPTQPMLKVMNGESKALNIQMPKQLELV